MNCVKLEQANDEVNLTNSQLMRRYKIETSLFNYIENVKTYRKTVVDMSCVPVFSTAFVQETVFDPINIS